MGSRDELESRGGQSFTYRIIGKLQLSCRRDPSLCNKLCPAMRRVILLCLLAGVSAFTPTTLPLTTPARRMRASYAMCAAPTPRDDAAGNLLLQQKDPMGNAELRACCSTLTRLGLNVGSAYGATFCNRRSAHVIDRAPRGGACQRSE
eukprot:1965119-Rhodomonas_salina.1